MAYQIMLLRTLLTTALVVVGLTAAVVVDCSTSYVELLDDELSNLCTTVSFLDAESGLWVGAGLAAFAVLGLFAIWTPILREAARRRRRQPAKAFVENLGRLADVGSQLSELEEEPASADVRAMSELVRRVEAVEAAITSEAMPSREATQQWMSLLREANDLHNAGVLATDDFKEVNTRLLELFTSPRSETGKLSGASTQLS